MDRATNTTRRRLRWLAIPAVATLLGFFFASRMFILYNAYPDNSITWSEALLLALTDWYLWALLTPLTILLAYAFPLERVGQHRQAGGPAQGRDRVSGQSM